MGPSHGGYEMDSLLGLRLRKQLAAAFSYYNQEQIH